MAIPADADGVEAILTALLSASDLRAARQIVDASWPLLTADLVHRIEAVAKSARADGESAAEEAIGFWAQVLHRCLLLGTAEAFGEFTDSGPVQWAVREEEVVLVGLAHGGVRPGQWGAYVRSPALFTSRRSDTSAGHWRNTPPYPQRDPVPQPPTYPRHSRAARRARRPPRDFLERGPTPGAPTLPRAEGDP